APVAHEDDADRAVRASLAMRARVAEHNPRSALAVELRIGINTGEVIAATDARNEFMVTGEPVVAAARLRAAADPGQTLVGALTRRLSEPGVRYARRRMVTAKGLGRIEASPVAGLASALPQPSRGVAGLRAAMVGRDGELATLRALHRRAAEGSRAYLATVFAPPGAGKSRLAEEFAAALPPGTTLRGRCLSYGQGITLWALQELLRQDARITLD
ncbi:MAG: AAA family ATPase, partial [Candidatus Limnocylindria bacterium]